MKWISLDTAALHFLKVRETPPAPSQSEGDAEAKRRKAKEAKRFTRSFKDFLVKNDIPMKVRSVSGWRLMTDADRWNEPTIHYGLNDKWDKLGVALPEDRETLREMQVDEVALQRLLSNPTKPTIQDRRVNFAQVQALGFKKSKKTLDRMENHKTKRWPQPGTWPPRVTMKGVPAEWLEHECIRAIEMDKNKNLLSKGD